eukprot:TRINITY_DN10160_c0_g1_i5.p1 TRINITY_DN10160_c0_g1~~TRINITY_DN10160_c0_g1_i5.p1  ORF type:complete len:701 (+),score=186.59 TRINITY_DN10160_c0_g1_i5:64-2166(+)
MSGSDEYAPLTNAIVKGLNDRLYDKRKSAAIEVEKLVKHLLQQDQSARVVTVIAVLRKKFIHGSNDNGKKGGLIAMAAAAMAISQSSDTLPAFLKDMVPPVLSCLGDHEARVRYFACEALYNISKVSRTHILHFFTRLFDALCKLAADPDANVKSGSGPLDRVLKDIVTEHGRVDLDGFIGLAKDRIRTIDPAVRLFLVSWIDTLNTVPGVDLVPELSKLLQGLFEYLSDEDREIRRIAHKTLTEFLRELQGAEQDKVSVPELMKIIVLHTSSKDLLTKKTAIRWVRDFITMYQRQLLPFVWELLKSVLPTLAKETETELKELAITVNQSLTKLVADADAQGLQSLNFPPLLSVLVQQLIIESVNTRTAALRWLLMLRGNMATEMYQHVDEFAPALLKTLSAREEKVIALDLELLAEMSSSDDEDNAERAQQAQAFFTKFLQDLMRLFSTDRQLLSTRGSFIIRTLCLLLNPYQVYSALADIISQLDDDPEFSPLMVQHLSIILLTATELSSLRVQLRAMETQEDKDLFCALYKCWCHSPISTLSLCLLAQVYDHACDVMYRCGRLDTTVGFLIELDKLVQLLESPIFGYLRLQLLEPHTYCYLIKCLYGLLMLLPQSSAYTTLKNRLDVIPVVASTLGELDTGRSSSGGRAGGNINLDLPFEQLLSHFDAVQEQVAKQAMGSAAPLLSKPPRPSSTSRK